MRKMGGYVEGDGWQSGGDGWLSEGDGWLRRGRRVAKLREMGG